MSKEILLDANGVIIKPRHKYFCEKFSREKRHKGLLPSRQGPEGDTVTEIAGLPGLEPGTNLLERFMIAISPQA